MILESLAAPASIPSPSENIVHLGPVPLHMYGLMLAIGILVAVRVAEVRWVRRGHSAKEFSDIVIWVVVAGVIGARVYHVITDYQLFTDDWLKAFKIWEGGLGIWGAVIGGAIAAVILTRRRHLDLGDLLDCIAPGLALRSGDRPVGQLVQPGAVRRADDAAVGRSRSIRRTDPHGYTQYATFQPTFLYESLYCLALGLALIWIDHHFKLKKFQLFALYCMGYTAGRVRVRGDAHRSCPHHRAAATQRVGEHRACSSARSSWFLWLGRHGTPVERPVPAEDGTGRFAFRRVAAELRVGCTPAVRGPDRTDQERPRCDRPCPRLLRRPQPGIARAVNVYKVYGSGEAEVRALDGISVEFGPREFTAIMGPSGSGKSTLLHCLAGLDRVSSGQIFLGDIEISAAARSSSR